MAPLKLIPPEEALPAPGWSVESWFNAREPLSLAELRGRVVVLHAFQMLCPGCVTHAIPQAQRVRALFPHGEVAVVGLHTVFEHHEAMRPVSLEAFLHEYRVGFPVGVDEPSGGSPVPKTMAAYQMRGTPTLVLIDQLGRLRLHAFGRADDIALGAAIATLVAERSATLGGRPRTVDAGALPADRCGDDGCVVE
jgi:peroxiredoxin